MLPMQQYNATEFGNISHTGAVHTAFLAMFTVTFFFFYPDGYRDGAAAHPQGGKEQL